ncbi:MAG: NAD-dependent epimerase/dehydratase family protein [Candidatus Zixiibacteriota bacterium]
MQKLTCLVTGGAGFVGSNLAIELENQGHNVIVIDNLFTGSKSNLEAFKGKFYQTDVSRPFEIKEKIDVIFHEAAITNPRFTDDTEMMGANIEGFKLVVELTKKKNSRLVYASTANLYGNGPVPMSESQTPELITAYGRSKLEMDNLTMHLKNKMHIVGLRYFNVFGPREEFKEKAASMVFHLMNQMKSGKRPRIFNHGEQKRDHIYINDVVTATINAMNARSGIYNVGSGVATSFNELVATLNKTLRTELKPDYFDMPYDPRTYQMNTQADITLAKRELNWQPGYSLEKGIQETIDWYSKKEVSTR